MSMVVSFALSSMSDVLSKKHLLVWCGCCAGRQACGQVVMGQSPVLKIFCCLTGRPLRDSSVASRNRNEGLTGLH